jgi:hypothetical protein
VLVSELVAYQAERLPSGLLRYGAPGSQHDDAVMALAMAWTAVSRRHRLVYPVPDSELVVKEFPLPDHWPLRVRVGYSLEHGSGDLGRARHSVGHSVSF